MQHASGLSPDDLARDEGVWVAERAAEAARDVRPIIGENATALEEGAASAQRTGAVLDGIGDLLGRASGAIDAVSASIADQGRAIAGIDGAVGDVVALARSNLGHDARVAERSEVLGAAFEHALAEGWIDAEGLFSRDYTYTERV